MESVITKVKGFTNSVQIVQTSCAWRSDSTQCFNDNFSKYSFANGIKVSYRNAAFDIFFQNLFTYAESYDVCVSLYFAK